MTPREIVAALEDGTLANEEFRHRQHIMAAWWYVGNLPLLEAVERMSASVRRFAALNPDLFRPHPGPLLPFYSSRRLHSSLAREQFILPDGVTISAPGSSR